MLGSSNWLNSKRISEGRAPAIVDTACPLLKIMRHENRSSPAHGLLGRRVGQS
jgi:hypothetical protein